MSGRRYSRRGRGGLSTAVDDTAHIASSFGPVGALWTGAIGFAFFHPDGQVKFPHPWPPQIPPGRTPRL